MEYWEFLLQKEGERSWQPLKSEKLTVEAGRYRIVAHSSRINADVEICVTHTTTEEVPPKRRSQKRSRRTNPDGLMVVIPFTYLKPGMWELRCCGDIMSDFLGKSWQNVVQLQVLATAQTRLSTVEPTPSQVEIDHKENLTSIADLAIEAASRDSEPEIVNSFAIASLPEILVQNGQNTPASPEISVQNGKNAPASEPVSLVEVETLIPLDLDELDADSVFSTNSTDAATPSNPILEQSLQMLEQILQQVLDPVLQEFDEPEPESPTEEPEETVTLSENPEWQGLTLTLTDDGYTAKRGEALTIGGVVDILAVNSSNEAPNSLFEGSLRYQLRDPQSSQLLLDVQHPLPEQAFPLTFNHTLEIPPCQTRLILGKVTLYDSTPTALSSQPFTITADLDELLESIIPGTKVMPVAKMLVLANKFASLHEEETFEQFGDIAIEPIVIDLIDTSLTPQRPLAPTAQKFMPPQIYQPITPTPKGSKSLNLPNFPKLPSAEANVEAAADEPKTVAEEISAQTTETLMLEASSPSELPIVQDLEEIPGEKEVSDSDGELAVLLVSLDDSLADVSEVRREAATITSVTETAVPDLELSELWDTPELEPAAEAPPTVDEPAVLDSAFQALNSHDRFLLRLNSLASDGELSQWLQSDVSPASNSTTVEGVNQANDLESSEVEDVTRLVNSEELIADFDALSWENSDEFGGNLVEEPPMPVEEEMPQLPQYGVGDSDWATEEIVVDDDDQPVFVPEVPVQPETVAKIMPPEPEPQSQLQKSQPRMPVPVKSETPIPAPKLVIPKNELAVGEPVVVRVKLPPHSARLCVKLWVQDRQSRALLDGPRWLVDMLPDGAGQLEAMTQVVVPYGFAEVRFEAIAVDLDSQRESHKVTVDCAVMAPDLPTNFSLEDFEA